MTGKSRFKQTLAEVRETVDRALSHGSADPEAAHGTEDAAYAVALSWIAEHSTDERAKQLAAECVRAFDAPHQRWFA